MTHQLLQDHVDLATAVGLLDDWIAYRMQQRHLPGLAIGIVYNGQLLWGRGYGYADLESKTAVTLDTRFRIASITKTFTATGILQLRDAGMLRLDDPVSDYLDWFDLRYEDAPLITIRNLLTHTAGLPRDSKNPMWTECEAPARADFIDDTRTRQPTRPPYKEFAYSNLGYSLLGEIIAAVSGQSWADYLQERVLDPLGMRETYPLPSADDPLLATGYSKEKDGLRRDALPFWLMNGFEASANFASSVNDMVKYAGFHLGLAGGGILSPYTLLDMHRVHWLYEKWDGGYGLGMGLLRIQDWQISGHGGGYPGYLTDFCLCHEHKTGVMVLTNALGSDPHAIVQQAFKLVLPAIVKATETSQPRANSAWEKYIGVYESDWDRTKVLIRDGQLQALSLEYIDSPPTELEPTDDEQVFVIKQAGQSNETVRFELDETGNVTRMWERNEYSRRL